MVAVAIDEALLAFSPQITYRQLAALIAALGIRPAGKRHQPRRGRADLVPCPCGGHCLRERWAVLAAG